ncbi:MAG TPA: hypothetical protein ENK32_05960 [Anaerolineae bacterium]|nr:hypothetical protein [Anaerolineae bacterium]
MIEDFGEIREVRILDGCQPEIGRLLWQLEATRWRLKECLEGLDTAVLDWQPAHGDNIGTLLYHIAAIEADWEALLRMEGKTAVPLNYRPSRPDEPSVPNTLWPPGFCRRTQYPNGRHLLPWCNAGRLPEYLARHPGDSRNCCQNCTLRHPDYHNKAYHPAGGTKCQPRQKGLYHC